MIASAPPANGEAPAYPGTCRDGVPSGKVERAFRVKVYDENISFVDGVMGRYSQAISAACGDFVIQRADGPFAYHLAVVVDDAASGVNQVVRGADLLNSTPRQMYLQRLLGLQVPSYTHLPLVIDPNGEKLSKRDNAVSLAAGRDLRRQGGALLLAALRYLGQSPPLFLTGAPCDEILAWAVAAFEPTRIPRFPASFPTPM
jgi:glutamyl-Q tRNA(Asp) synthetase